MGAIKSSSTRHALKNPTNANADPTIKNEIKQRPKTEFQANVKLNHQFTYRKQRAKIQNR